MKFSIKDFFSESDQVRRFLRIWSHLLKKSLMENFIFCAVMVQKLRKKCTKEHLAMTASHKHITTVFNGIFNKRV